MSQIRLHAHVAPPGFIDVWLGIADITEEPELTWTLDGEPTVPTVLRPLEAVRVGDSAPADGRPRLFTGGFRLPAGPGDARTVTVQCAAGLAMLKTAAVPRALPEGRWFNVLLGSCFDRTMERTPLLANKVVRHLCDDPDTRPDMALFMGDQVYLDVPPTEVIGRFGEPGLGGITAQFEEDYRLNWMVHLADVLGAAPFVCVPDDHEFWNNYPTRVAWIPRTGSTTGREEWQWAARRCYDAYQRPVGLADPAVIDIGPISFFVLDTRTWRTAERDRCAQEAHLDELEAWAERIRREERFGFFVTGQTLFKKRVGDAMGWFTDYELANYGDYKRIIDALYHAATPDRPLFCLTGDVHFGRVVQAADRQGRPRMYEIISSPLSLCSDPRSAHQPVLSTLFQRIFGELWLQENRPWPRHPAPAVSRSILPTGSDPEDHLRCVSRYSQQGNQVAILGIRHGKRPGQIQVRVGYVALHPNEKRWKPVWVGPFNPRNGIDLLAGLGLSDGSTEALVVPPAGA